MRRREKFIISSLLLSALLLSIQAFPLEWHMQISGVFMVVTFLVSAWALSDNLNKHEWLTILPMPALFAGSVAFFYTLLPGTILSRIFVFIVYAIGMYALLLTDNIYSVAKGRSIQLLHAAHAVGFFFMMFASILFTQTIYSLRLPFYAIGGLVFVVHLPLIFVSLWSVLVKEVITKEVLAYSVLFSLLLAEFAMVFSLLPMQVWYSALFVMSLMYLSVSYVRSVLLGRLFTRTFTEYAAAAIFLLLFFIFVFPLK
jgi:hypothetical protein